MPSSISDDDVIKRRLLLEGDSGSDDRRITQLLRMIVRWTSDDNVSADENTDTYYRVLSLIAQCEHAMERTLLVQRMNESEQRHYEELNSRIEHSIQKAQEGIEKCKAELVEAKKVRRHRQEYDNLAKVINERPEREATLSRLEKINDELQELKRINERLDSKLDSRQKQFRVLLVTVRDLQNILENEETEVNDRYESCRREEMEIS